MYFHSCALIQVYTVVYTYDALVLFFYNASFCNHSVLSFKAEFFYITDTCTLLFF